MLTVLLEYIDYWAIYADFLYALSMIMLHDAFYYFESAGPYLLMIGHS